MIMLFTGDRNWTRPNIILRTLRELRASEKPWLAVVHGDCATGADQQCKRWCVELGIPEFRCPANWAFYGKAAGPIRNKWMLYVRPAYVFGFHENLAASSGTLSMLRQAKHAKIPYCLHDGHRWTRPEL